MDTSAGTSNTHLSTLTAKDAKIRELESALVALAQERNPERHADVFNELKSKLQDAARELQAKAREVDALNATHAADKTRLLTSHAALVRELEEDLDRHKVLRDEIHAINSQQQEAITKFQEAWRLQDAKRTELKTRIKDLEAELEMEQSARQEFTGKSEALQLQVSQLEGANAGLVADAKAVDARLAAVSAEKTNLDRCVTDQAAELCASKTALESERTCAASLTLRVDELSGQCERLIAERDIALARVGELLQADFSRVAVKLERHSPEPVMSAQDNALSRLATLQTEYEEVRQALPVLREDYEANASELQRLGQKLADTAILQRDLANARAEAAARATERDEALVLSGLALRERDVLSKRVLAMQSEHQAYEVRRSPGGTVATAAMSFELAARDGMIQSLKDAKESFIARYAALQAQKTQLQRERDELFRDVAAVKSKLQAVVADRDEAVHSLKTTRDQVHAVVKERDRASDEAMEMRNACEEAVTMIQNHRFTAHLALQVRLNLLKHLPLPFPQETLHPTTGEGTHARWLLQNFRTLLFYCDEVLDEFPRQNGKVQEAIKREQDAVKRDRAAVERDQAAVKRDRAALRRDQEAVKRVELVVARYENCLKNLCGQQTLVNAYGVCLRILQNEQKKIPVTCNVAQRVLEVFREAVDRINPSGDFELRVDALQNRYNNMETQRNAKVRELLHTRDEVTRFKTIGVAFRDLTVAFKEHADSVPEVIIRPLYQLAAYATTKTRAPADLESQLARTRAVEEEVANLQLAAGCWEEQTDSLTAQLEALKSELSKQTSVQPASEYLWTPVKRPRNPAPESMLWPTKRVRFE